MATTRSRSRGRENAPAPSGGVAAEHTAKIYGAVIVIVLALVAFLALTSTGRVIDAATQRFMLFYAGVFALIALCGAVALGLIATDRMILQPGHRVLVQSAHRAASFGAVAFLFTHIFTEILAQRVHVLDAVVPFLSPFRTFYIGLGTIASDLVVLLVITGILRKRFTGHGKAWRWRAMHYTAYVAFVFGVWHGLLGGRPGKPYVDWSYGFVVALVALGLSVRILANSLRPKETLSGPPVAQTAMSGSAPMRAAAMFARLSLARTASSPTMSASSSQVLLSSPVGAWDVGPSAAIAALPAAPGAPGAPGPYGIADDRQPLYEPGYEGPPRYLGAPRRAGTGPQPQVDTGPMARATTGPLAQAPNGTGQRRGAGPMPRASSGPMPRASSGPMPRAESGPMPRASSGPMSWANSGPMPRAGTGPMPRADSGPMPRADSGPMPRADSGPMPRASSGPMLRVPSGPMPRANSGPMPNLPSGSYPRVPTGPFPPMPSGPFSQVPDTPRHRRDSGPMPRPRANSGPMSRADSGPMPRANSGPMPRANGGPMPRAETGQSAGRSARGWDASARPGWTSSAGWAEYSDWGGSSDWDESPGWAGAAATWNGNFGVPPWEGGTPEPDLDFRYREPGPGMPGYLGGRHRFAGGDGL